MSEILLNNTTNHDPKDPSQDLLNEGELEAIRNKEQLIARQILAQKPVYERLTACLGFGIEFSDDKTCFDHENKKLLISVPQLLELGLSSMEQINYIVLHEIGHYLELLQDTEGYEKLIHEAKTIDHGDIIFKLYNCLQDIYVNTNSSNCSPVYRNRDDFSEVVKDIYRKHTFPERDFTDQPLCMQYAHYLLNSGMGVADDIILSPEINEIIGQGLKMHGQSFSYKDFIDKFLRPVLNWDDTLFRPHNARDLSPTSWQGSISQRKSVTDLTIRPIFEKLLEKDIENGRVKEVDVWSDSGQGELIGDHSAQEIEKILETAKIINKNRNLTDEEKAAIEREKQLRKAGTEKGVHEDTLTDFIERYERLQPQIAEIANLWRQIKIPSVSWQSKKEGHFLTGDTLDISQVIKKFPEILLNPGSQELMYRNLYSPQQSMLPKEIILLLEIDCSGSMSGDMPIVQDLVITLGSSIIARNSQSDLDGDEIKCSLGIVTFESEAKWLLKTSNELSIAELMKKYSELSADGGTSDHLAHEKIIKSLSPQKIEEIKNGESLAIMIEITDGDTSQPESSKALINELENLGIICRAIKISGMHRADNKEEKPTASLLPEEAISAIQHDDTFESIWNSGGEKKGLRVSQAKYLKNAIYRMLEKFLVKET